MLEVTISTFILLSMLKSIFSYFVSNVRTVELCAFSSCAPTLFTTVSHVTFAYSRNSIVHILFTLNSQQFVMKVLVGLIYVLLYLPIIDSSFFPEDLAFFLSA